MTFDIDQLILFNKRMLPPQNKKNEYSLNDIIKHNDIYIIEVPKGEVQEIMAERLSKEIMTETFPNLI